MHYTPQCVARALGPIGLFRSLACLALFGCFVHGVARASEVGEKVARELAQLRQPAAVIAGALPISPRPASAAIELNESRLLFYLAQTQPEVAEDKRVAWFEEGRGKALSVLERQPEEAAAVFWWAANEGGRSRLRKSLSSLAAIAHVETALLKLREAHPEYGDGAADRLLAAIYIAAPAMISIGSYSKAEASLKRALQRFPDFPGNHIGWIHYLKARGRDAEAQTEARALIASGTLKKTYGDFEYDRPGWDEQLAAALPSEKRAASP